jgi:hypothetical protein
MTLADVLVAAGLSVVSASMAAPGLAALVDAARGRSAAQFLAGECRRLRAAAAATGRTHAMVFDQAGADWAFRSCEDGNSNGMRRADIASGRDTCASPVVLAALFGGATIDVATGLPDPDGSGVTSGAVRFGSSGIASFTATGTATAGTVYVRSPRGAQFAVRVAGTTGRLRVLRFEAVSRSWREA